MRRHHILKSIGLFSLATVLMIGFQNCSGVKFGAPTSNFADDGQPVIAADVPVQELPVIVDTPPPVDGLPPAAQPPEILPPASTGPEYAANCDRLRDLYDDAGIQPGELDSVVQSGKTQVGPLFVRSVKSVVASGSATTYLVGSSTQSLVDKVTLSGSTHVVLCGINAGKILMSGSAQVDLVGSNLLGTLVHSGASNIRFFTRAGVQIQ